MAKRTFRFAHFSDVHLGAWREKGLRELPLQAFISALDQCMVKQVDFIVISGDLFHTHVPELDLVNRAVQKLREVRERGIRIYVIYGSHDFSPRSTSVIDVLTSAGLFEKVVRAEQGEDGTIHLGFVQDEATGAKLAGLSARQLGLERTYFEQLDRTSLEREQGTKIFLFHTAITEYRPKHWVDLEGIPLSLLPKGFAYYAAGHVHHRILESPKGYGPIAYPGALFGSDFRDLENVAEGRTERGFFLVDVDNGVAKPKFVPVSVAEVAKVEVDLIGLSAAEASGALLRAARGAKVQDKVVLVRAFGQLASGKVYEVDFPSIEEHLLDNGAVHVQINRASLSSAEEIRVQVVGKSRDEIEETVFRESLSRYRPSDEGLAEDRGLTLAKSMLSRLKVRQQEGETNADYSQRVLNDACEALGVELP